MSTTSTPTDRDKAHTLHELARRMHAAVVHATEVGGRAAKVEQWDAYRAARAEALAMIDAGHPGETVPAGDTASAHWEYPQRAESPAA